MRIATHPMRMARGCGTFRRESRYMRSTEPSFSARRKRSRIRWLKLLASPRVLIIRMRDVLLLDSTGMHALKDVVHRSRKDGTVVLLSDVHMQPLVALTGSAVLEEIGPENLFSNLDDALQRAGDLLVSPLTPGRIAAMTS